MALEGGKLRDLNPFSTAAAHGTQPPARESQPLLGMALEGGHLEDLRPCSAAVTRESQPLLGGGCSGDSTLLLSEAGRGLNFCSVKLLGDLNPCSAMAVRGCQPRLDSNRSDDQTSFMIFLRDRLVEE
ncbi:hypothetical protein U1Q18_005996 [Sarracenia purpurea var. burkii]